MSVLLTDHIFLQVVGRVSEGLRGRGAACIKSILCKVKVQ